MHRLSSVALSLLLVALATACGLDTEGILSADASAADGTMPGAPDARPHRRVDASHSTSGDASRADVRHAHADASHDGGAHDGGPASGCSIDGATYAPGAVHAQNPCESCEPAASASAWTTTNGVNQSCPSGEVCSTTCQPGCWIDGAYYASGATTNHGCEVCAPSASTTAWQAVSGSASCTAGEVCNGGGCAAGCFIDGAYYASGATANSGCEVCTPSSSTTAWTNASDGKGCGNSQVCSAGACGTQCNIGGTGIVASGAVNPTNPCESCQPGMSTSAWSSTDGVNVACPSGDVCNGQPASCAPGCSITGAFVSASALNPSNPCESCQPSGTGGTTAWTDADGLNAMCPAAEVCNGQPAACVSGCFIAGTFYAGGTTSNLGCEVCTPSSSTSAWTDVSGVAGCSSGEVCQGGSCTSGCVIGGAYHAPSAVNPSDPCETCQPGGSGGTTAWTDTDGVNASCPSGQVCNGQTATCVPGCFIAGSFYSPMATANLGCEVCTPSSSMSSWTDVTGPAGCPSGEACQGGSCVATVVDAGQDSGTCLGPGQNDQGSQANCCSGTQAANLCGCITAGSADLGSDMNCCSGTSNAGTCGCIGPGQADQGTQVNCCSGSQSANVCGCITAGSSDKGTDTNCCSGTSNAGTCGCIGPGQADQGTQQNCCSGTQSANVCGCITAGSSDKGTDTNCCSGTSNRGTCGCIGPGQSDQGTQENCCSGMQAANVCGCIANGSNNQGSDTNCCSGKAEGNGTCCTC